MPRSTRLTRTGAVRSVRRERWVSMPGEPADPGPATVPWWPKPVSLFGLFLMTAFLQRPPVCTRPSIPPALRRMPAETPPPHGCGAGRVPVGALSGGFRPRVPVLLYPVGYCGWHHRSGPYNLSNVPDNQPCDLVSQEGMQAPALWFPGGKSRKCAPMERTPRHWRATSGNEVQRTQGARARGPPPCPTSTRGGDPVIADWAGASCKTAMRRTLAQLSSQYSSTVR